MTTNIRKFIQKANLKDIKIIFAELEDLIGEESLESSLNLNNKKKVLELLIQLRKELKSN